jgi:hypothetical protein
MRVVRKVPVLQARRCRGQCWQRSTVPVQGPAAAGPRASDMTVEKWAIAGRAISECDRPYESGLRRRWLEGRH